MSGWDTSGKRIADGDHPEPATDKRRVYLFYSDPGNFERVDVRETSDGCVVLTWEAAGIGTHRQPVGWVVGDKLVVRGYPIPDRKCGDPDPHVLLPGAAGKEIVFDLFPFDAPGVVAQR